MATDQFQAPGMVPLQVSIGVWWVKVGGLVGLEGWGGGLVGWVGGWVASSVGWAGGWGWWVGWVGLWLFEALQSKLFG